MFDGLGKAIVFLCVLAFLLGMGANVVIQWCVRWFLSHWR